MNTRTVCHICDDSNEKRQFELREQMFGVGETFVYRECANCGTIQIVELPEYLSKYYPDDYYSYATADFGFRKSWFRRTARYYAARFLLQKKGFFGKLAITARPQLRDVFPEFLAGTGIDQRSRVLDVGCGSGRGLELLAQFGFSSLTGVDPFIPESVVYDDGVRVEKCELGDLSGEFDLIIFNHSLEHFLDPVAALRSASQLMGPVSKCIVRIPVVAAAWERYGVDWVQLDAPRHLISFTEAGFRLAAAKAGLTVDSVVYDSTAFQFWGSEQVKKGIPIAEVLRRGGESYIRSISGDMWPLWKKKALEWNAAACGDQASFFLSKMR